MKDSVRFGQMFGRPLPASRVKDFRQEGAGGLASRKGDADCRKSWGRTVPGMLEEQQRGPCGWDRGVRGREGGSEGREVTEQVRHDRWDAVWIIV